MRHGPSRLLRAALVVVAAAALASAAGTTPAPAPAATPHRAAAWQPPSKPPLQLLALDAAFKGPKPTGSATLARWSGKDLASWTRKTVPGGVQFVSPTLGPELSEAVRLRITVRPGGASTVKVMPVLDVKQAKNVQRSIRGFDIPLPPAADPAKPVALESDVKETLRGNWADEAEQAPLQRIEITLPGASEARAALDEVSFEGEDAVFSREAAGAAVVERGGVMRPAFFAHGGATVRVTVEVPKGDPQLRWSDGSLGEGGPRGVAVISGTTRTELARYDKAQAKWAPASASLAKWAGQKVTLELFAEDASSRMFGVRVGKERQGLAFFGTPRIVQAPAPSNAPDVVVYLVDMLRADKLGAWGSAVPNVSPEIDRLAREGVAFRNTISSSNWTKPAIPTLLTGVWEATHRVGAESYTDRLPDGVPMIQERFRQAGWRTGSFAANPLGSTLSGLTRGFDAALPPRYWSGQIGPLGSPAADQLQQALFQWIDEEPDQPFFAYVHTMEVHRYAEPLYAKPPAGLTPYDASIRDASSKLGPFVERLAKLRSGRDLLVVFVADHGHSLGEHGREGHGISLYQPEVHIPLIFWSKTALAPRWVDSLAGLADVAPTLADLVHLPALPDAQGVSLVPLLLGADRSVHEFLPSSLLRFVRFPDAPQQFSVVTPKMEKCIRVGTEDPKLFDLRGDPGEQKPLPAAKTNAQALLQRWMDGQKDAAMRFRGRHGVGRAEPIDAEAVERLRSLGYVK